MKHKEQSLLYHTMHSRPMPGCLPLFFCMALVFVGICFWLVPVRLPDMLRPAGRGKVYDRKDDFTEFLIRRRSPLPLQLPQAINPDYQEDAEAIAIPLLRSVELQDTPEQEMFGAPASVVLDAAELLALPPAREQDPPQGKEVQP